MDNRNWGRVVRATYRRMGLTSADIAEQHGLTKSFTARAFRGGGDLDRAIRMFAATGLAIHIGGKPCLNPRMVIMEIDKIRMDRPAGFKICPDLAGSTWYEIRAKKRTTMGVVAIMAEFVGTKMELKRV